MPTEFPVSFFPTLHSAVRSMLAGNPVLEMASELDRPPGIPNQKTLWLFTPFAVGICAKEQLILLLPFVSLTGESNCTLPPPKGRLQRQEVSVLRQHVQIARRGISSGYRDVHISVFVTFPLQIALLVR